MPTITTGPNGFRISFAQEKHIKQAHQKAKLLPTTRGACSGWSAAASARNTLALQSIDFAAFRGCPVYAVTLTLARSPESSVEYKRLKDVFEKRLRRMGLDCWHWVCEWAQVGRFGVGAVPHLHMTIFNRHGVAADLDWWPIQQGILIAWIRVFQAYGAQLKGQHLRVIDSPQKWVGYVAKHTARAARHVQREQILPEGWTSPGRMWGMTRNMPTKQNVIELPDTVAFAFRRLALRYLRSLEKTRLKKTDNPKKHKMVLNRLRYLANYLQNPHEVSMHLPLTEFIPEFVTALLLENALKTRYDPELETHYG